jgi:hypothetical protein
MEQSKGFAVEIGTSWKRWAKRRSDEELLEVQQRLEQLTQSFGKPHEHAHAGLGVRLFREDHFEFRISRGLRVIFLLIKPRPIRLMIIGNHDEVRACIKENL